MRLVNQAQAAQMLGVSDRTVRNLISRGVFTGYQVPHLRAVRLDADEIKAKLRVIPAVREQIHRKPFGPRAVIKPAPLGAPIVPETHSAVTVQTEAETEEESR